MRFNVGSFHFEFRFHRGFFWLPTNQRDEGRRNYFMFAQDVAGAIAPPSSRGSDEDGPAYGIEGEEAERVRATALLSRLAERGRRANHSKTVKEVVRQVAEWLPWNGRVLIDMRETPHATGDRERARIWHSGRAIRVLRWCLQAGLLARREGLGFHLAIVPRKEVVEITIPISLGGLGRYRRHLRRLDRFDELGPDWWKKDLGSGALFKMQAQIDQAGYRRRAAAYRDWVMKDWGWNGREASNSHGTEYFVVYRHLRLHRAGAIIREAILAAMQSQLATQRIDARITCQLPTARDIDQVIERLRDGEVSIGQAIKEVRTT